MSRYEAEQAVAAFFHANRAMRKRKRDNGGRAIFEAMQRRNEIIRQERMEIEQAAERYAWEVASEI